MIANCLNSRREDRPPPGAGRTFSFSQKPRFHWAIDDPVGRLTTQRSVNTTLRDGENPGKLDTVRSAWCSLLGWLTIASLAACSPAFAQTATVALAPSAPCNGTNQGLNWGPGFGCVTFSGGGGSGAAPVPSRSWNAEFFAWQRGTSFTNGGIGAFTADRTVNGPGVGGAITVAKEILTSVIRNQITNAPAPRFAKKITWNTAPTAGEGRPGYPKYFSAEEMRDDDVTMTAGKTITVSAWVWTSAGSTPFFLYASQGFGLAGNSGKQSTGGNSISGTGAGTDYSFAASEIFYRSAQMIATTTPQLFSATFALDDLALATVQSDNVFTIGAGTNFDALVAGVVLHITLEKYDSGSAALPWVPIPDGAVLQAAQYNYARFGLGLYGTATLTNAIQVALPYRAVFKNNGPAGVNLLTTSPVFACGTVGTPGTNSAIMAQSVNQNGALITINGFGPGLTLGQSCRYAGSGDLLEAAYE